MTSREKRQAFMNGFWRGFLTATLSIWGALFIGMLWLSPFIFWALVLRALF